MQKLPFNNIELEYLLENVKSIFATLERERPLIFTRSCEHQHQ